jgi:hypothetical protein
MRRDLREEESGYKANAAVVKIEYKKTPPM